MKKAIESLTIVPARSLNLGDKLGKIEKNFLANFIITSDHYLMMKLKLMKIG